MEPTVFWVCEGRQRFEGKNLNPDGWLVRISQRPQTKDKEVTGADKESEQSELASGCHPAKNDIFLQGTGIFS